MARLLFAQDRMGSGLASTLQPSLTLDPTLAVTLSALAAEQSNGTEATAKAVVKLLNYCATHPDAAIQYRPSDMILRVHSDTSYLTEPKARSRMGGHFYMGNQQDTIANGPILNPTGVIKVVVSSAAESETAGLFTNMKEAVALRTTLEEMGHPQPATPIQVDNSTACGIANDTIKQRRSKAIDMRFYWVQDRVNQKQFHVFWKPGKENLADYVTKHHTAKHHQEMRDKFLHKINMLYQEMKTKQDNLADYATKHQRTDWHHQAIKDHFLQQINKEYKDIHNQAPTNRTHCKGVLIPTPHSDLATIKQCDTKAGTTDRRHTDRHQASRAPLINHKRVQFTSTT